MSVHANLSAAEALNRLKAGNLQYMSSLTNPGDISPQKRIETAEHGQHPYAVILCCSDSREIPESIFSTGIGELFVIRVAGNVVDDQQLASVEYAADHLGCRLVLVMGHNHCGAVGAALEHAAGGHLRSLMDQIQLAIGDETDEYKACCLNVSRSVSLLRQDVELQALPRDEFRVLGAVYHLEDGHVDFMED